MTCNIGVLISEDEQVLAGGAVMCVIIRLHSGEKLVDNKVFSAYSSALASVRLVGCCLKLMDVRVSFGFDCERVRLSPARDIFESR